MTQASSPADIFLSYARKDSDRATALAQALERLGYSVWWDPDIPIGDNYLRAIEDKLRAARVAVVLWSPQSVASDWVLAEASLARDLGKLVPVVLADVEIPLAFHLIEAANLSTWQGADDHPGFMELRSALNSRLEHPALPPTPEPPKNVWSRIPKPLLAARWLALLTLLLIGGVTALMKWRIPADVEVDVEVSSVQLGTIGPVAEGQFERPYVRSVAFLGIDQFALAASSAAVANSARWNVIDDSYPEDAWTPLAEPEKLVLIPASRNRRADVTVRSLNPLSPSFQIGCLLCEPGDLTLDSPEPNVLSVRIEGARSGTLTLPANARLDTAHCAREDRALPGSPQSAVIGVRPADSQRVLHYVAPASGITIQVSFPSSDSISLVPNDGLDVDHLKFEEVLTEGGVKSSVQGDGDIRYRSPPLEPVKLARGDILKIDDLSKFRVASATFEKAGGLRLRVDGIAGILRSGRTGFVEDRRPVMFDKLWKNNRLTALVAIVGAFLTFVVVARKFLVELSAG